MLKKAATWIASTSACVAYAGRGTRRRPRSSSSRDRASSSPGSRASPAAARRSAPSASRAATACQTSSPSAYDATAPWEPVQNGHWLSDETKAAKSSRSPSRPVGRAAHGDLERVGERPAEELRPVVERLQDVGGSAPRAARMLASDSPRAGSWPFSTQPSLIAASRGLRRAARARRRRPPTRSARRSRPRSDRRPSGAGHPHRSSGRRGGGRSRPRLRSQVAPADRVARPLEAGRQLVVAGRATARTREAYDAILVTTSGDAEAVECRSDSVVVRVDPANGAKVTSLFHVPTGANG